MTKEEMVAIVNQVVEILEQRQRDASERLVEALNRPTPTQGIAKPFKGQEMPPVPSEKGMSRTISPYYKTAKHDGLPAGVCFSHNKEGKAYFKATLCGEYFGCFPLDEAIKVRLDAQKAFDA